MMVPSKTTIIARSAFSLQARLSSLQIPASSTLLFALSPNVPPSSLSALVTRLTTASRSVVGCLSAPLVPNHVSCSLAILPDAVTFYSSLPGLSAPQVGRWHSFRTKEPVDEYRSDTRPALPPALSGIKPSSILYLSDRAPEGLLSALSIFPVSSLGLIASSTPFITGRPFTLFHNTSIHSSGAVGVALTSSPPSIHSSFPGALSLSPPMTITASQGNMVTALDNTSPTQLLLSFLPPSLSSMSPTGNFKDISTFLIGTPSQMYRITAGDPSRGPISLDPQNTAPPVGSQVQFYHLPSPTLSLPPPSPAFTFLTAPESTYPLVPEFDSGSDPTDLDYFLAASENGYVLSNPSTPPWTCTIPNAFTSIDKVTLG